MLSCPWKLSASRLRINSVPRTIMPNVGYMIKHTTSSTSSASFVKNIYPCVGLGIFSSCKGLYSFRAMHKDNTGWTSHVIESCQGILEETNLTAEVHVDSLQHILESVDSGDDKEIQTEKIVHGNKGRVPWNKGRKHSEETRERIRRRTKEVLKDPKVRKKMSEAPRALSNLTKAKIRVSLTKLWRKRLAWKRSREKFVHSWAESIAKAAKIGGSDQQELEWDSYEKLKQEIALQQIHQDAEKAKAKEMARIRAERAAQVKAEKMAKLARKRREWEENAKVTGKLIRKSKKKSKEEKEKLAEFQEEKLKERLMKIRKKKSTISQVSNQRRQSWEKFDLDIAKGGQLRKDISLADQIRFAKERRAEQLLDKF